MNFVVSRAAKLAVLTLAFFTFQVNAFAAPTCQFASSDPDGDGWGWENNDSCIVAPAASNTQPSSTNTEHPTCSSNAVLNGDGWGWENNASCKVRSVTSSTYQSAYPFCTSNALLNGDGWGWENNATCRENPNANTGNQEPETTPTPTAHPTCSENAILNGDGWGWENNASCKEEILAKEPAPPTAAALPGDSTPFESYGRLSVCGTKLCSEDGRIVQLMGMSSHGIHWFPWGSCLDDDSLDMLAYDWKTDIYRIAMYVSGGKPEYQQYAFIDDETLNIDEVNKQIEEVSKRGMYVLVDFHVLSENPRQLYTQHAKRFFKAVAAKNSHRENVIYEIANEPTQTTWQELREYAAEVIPVIRNVDPDAIIVVGTRQWSSFNHGDYLEVVNNPINEDNIMYAFHAYAPDQSHQQKYLDAVINASKSIPVFVTEWGSTEASGQHAHSDYWGQRYVDAMEEHNISWVYWNFSSDNGESSIWKNNYCWTDDKDWSDSHMKPTGHFIKSVFTER